MELMKNLRWMCRVCAVNIRKRRSSSSAVPIFDTPELLQKLKKYLHMDVEYNDKLPKSICSNCFKRLESVCNFAVLAKKTENFLKDFISIAENNLKNTTTSQISARFQSEFASFALLSTDKQDIIICDEQAAFNESDELSMLEMEDTYREMEERGLLAAEHPLSPGPLHYIPTKSDHTSIGSSPERSIGPPVQKNNLDQKRKNLKMILANNNAQAVQTATKNTSMPLPPPPPLIPTSEPEQKNEPLIYDCLNLGCVIKDMDLLKLILKALKWPFTKDTLSAQVHRLKNTRFRDVMVDPNLLQDTDLMQILSSYLSPILLHSQNANTNAVTAGVNPNVNSVLPTTLHTYKIPADTSVHLVSVPIESTEKRPRLLAPHKPKGRRRQYKPRVIKNESPIEILSDDDSGDVQNFEYNIDPALYFLQDSESQDNSTESLVMSLVGKSRPSLDNNTAKVRKKQRRKEAHVKLHTDRKPEEDLVIINDSGQEDMKNCVLNSPSRREKEKDSIFLDSDTLGAQFPLVAIIDENSNDDALWAEFKVVESPLHDESGENISNRSFMEASFIYPDVGQSQKARKSDDNLEKEMDLKKDIKQEVVDICEQKEIKTEPVDQDISERVQEHTEPQEEIITPDEPRRSFEAEPFNIKQEPVEKEERSQNMPDLGSEGKVEPEQQILQERIKSPEEEEKGDIVKKLEEVEEQVVIEEEQNEGPENELILIDKEYRRKDCTRNKEKQVRESKNIKETGRVTRSTSRVQSLTNGKRISRSTRRLSYSPVKKKDSKFSRPCKRRLSSFCDCCGKMTSQQNNDDPCQKSDSPSNTELSHTTCPLVSATSITIQHREQVDPVQVEREGGNKQQKKRAALAAYMRDYRARKKREIDVTRNEIAAKKAKAAKRSSDYRARKRTAIGTTTTVQVASNETATILVELNDENEEQLTQQPTIEEIRATSCTESLERIQRQRARAAKISRVYRARQRTVINTIPRACSET